jgi:putrescine:ornithine antiporter
MESEHKMTLSQLTLIVVVNMMGTGIIVLPTNMARIGAVSLLSWIVTALGSMAVACALAQAGLFNGRSGGLAAYAEDAYGNAGYFHVFYLYFLSVSIANVAVAISAVSHLAAFVPWLSPTPAVAALGAISLLSLTTLANFGGPRLTGRIGSLAAWGAILPVGLISVVGWVWFDAATFAAAWNPRHLTPLDGMMSGMPLTMWAFLGMETAAQNASAVTNPRRTVPLACLLGTLGAAAIYVVSTMVIQGIVPNSELATSTGPFALVFARMVGPTAGAIVLVLAVVGCVGSLVGWQFTLACTGRSAADNGWLPAVFSRTTRTGAPVAVMVVTGILQSLTVLMTVSPSLGGQFDALVDVAVVTTAVPYVLAISALPVMMRTAGVRGAAYARTLAVALVALLYCVAAICASGKDAVFGAVLVAGFGFVISRFVAARFRAGSRAVLSEAA